MFCERSEHASVFVDGDDLRAHGEFKSSRDKFGLRRVAKSAETHVPLVDTGRGFESFLNSFVLEDCKHR